MDLTRLYNFTTPELREEAERLGVRDTYALSRGQLIQAIRDHLEPPTAKKRGLFGTVVGLAKWAVQAATEAGTDREPAVEPESAPAPVAAPLTMATQGLGISCRTVTTRRPSSRMGRIFSKPASSSFRASICLTSPPVQNQRAEPVRTTTRTSSSSWASRRAWRSSSRSSRPNRHAR